MIFSRFWTNAALPFRKKNETLLSREMGRIRRVVGAVLLWCTAWPVSSNTRHSASGRKDPCTHNRFGTDTVREGIYDFEGRLAIDLGVYGAPETFFIDNRDTYVSLLEGEFKRVANFALISNNVDFSATILSGLPDEAEIKELYDQVFEMEQGRLENEIEEYRSQA